MRFFFFGLLADPDILNEVAGRPIPGHPFPSARLSGHRLVHLRRETFPMLIADAGHHVPGVLVDGLSEAEVERIIFFESVEYEPRPLTVEFDGTQVEAHAFATTARAVAHHEPWTFQAWQARFKAHDLREAMLWMSFHGVVDVAEADRLWEAARAAGRPFEDLVAEVCGAAPKAKAGGVR